MSLCGITSVSADQWGRGDIVPVKTVMPGVKAAWVRVWQLLLLWLHHVYRTCKCVQRHLLTTVTRHFSLHTVEAAPQFTLTHYQFGRQKLQESADVYLGELLSGQ